jgi:hypothetical protein
MVFTSNNWQTEPRPISIQSPLATVAHVFEPLESAEIGEVMLDVSQKLPFDLRGPVSSSLIL